MTTIGKAMQDALNEQINKEFFSSYLYLSMAAYFEDKNLTGFAHWMRLQADEEREHAMKFYHFILDSGGRVQLKEIESGGCRTGRRARGEGHCVHPYSI